MRRLHRGRWGPAIGGFLDDELEPAALDRVLRHLEDCPDCRYELDLLALVQRSLARLAVPH